MGDQSATQVTSEALAFCRKRSGHLTVRSCLVSWACAPLKGSSPEGSARGVGRDQKQLASICHASLPMLT